MIPALPLDQMSVEEKIQTMETIWDDLCHLSDSVKSPGWHREVLAEREAALACGKDAFEDWDAAKENIRKQIS